MDPVSFQRMQGFLYLVIKSNLKIMKNTLILLGCALSMTWANAQLPSSDTRDYNPMDEQAAHVMPPPSFAKDANNNDLQKAGGDTIWYEDFGGGFPNSWSIQDSSGICPWTYTLDGSWGFWNDNDGTGPGDDTLQSVTKANGFLICDPDSANHAVYGQPSGTTYQYLDSYFTTSAIDLSAYPAVLLQFEHLFRFNNGIDLIVGVSADNTTWTNYTVQGSTPNNTQSANAETANINISSVAGNQSTVYVRLGWSARVYYWMVDDIRIVEAPGNDLTVTMEKHYPFYKMTPVRQAADITFTGAIANNGGNTQANVQLNTTATLLGDTVFNDSSAPMSSAPAANDTVTIVDSSYMPSLLGDYLVENYVTSDSADFNPSDDSLNNNFMITDSVYARDENTYTGWGVRTSTNGTKLRGIMYDIWQQDTLSSISVLVTGLTPENGQVVQFHLYDTTLLFPIASSAFYTIQPSDLGNWITLSFPEFVLTPGQYIAAIESFSDSVYVHFDPDAPLPLPQTSFYFADNGNWYYSSSYTYFVRMNTKRPMCNTNISVTTTNSTCDLSDAMAYVVASGGLMPYTYSWITSPVQASDTAVGLSAGIYTLTVNDGLGCTYTEVVTIEDVGAASLAISATNVTCQGDANGTATVTVTGGTAPLTYSWSNGATSTTTINLIGGTYNVTVSGANNCISAASVVITEPAALILSTMGTTPEISNNAGDSIISNGSISTSVSGGTGAYTYTWNTNPMESTANATGLVAGTYTGLVTDGSGCQDSVTVTIPLIIGINNIQPNSIYTIYPNPTTGIIDIEINPLGNGTVAVAVYNIVGEKMLQKLSAANNLTVDMTGFRSGVYVLKLTTSRGVFAHRVIKN